MHAQMRRAQRQQQQGRVLRCGSRRLLYLPFGFGDVFAPPSDDPPAAAASGAKSVITSSQKDWLSRSVILLQMTWLGHGCTSENAPYGSVR